MVDLGQASSGAGECHRSLERADHYRWTLLADMFEKRVRLYLHSHIEVFAMLRNVRVAHEPSQARMNGKRVTITATMCASTSSLMSRLLCALCAMQDACNSPSKKTSSNKDDLQRAWLYPFTRPALNTSVSCRLAQSHKKELLEQEWLTAFDRSVV